MGIVHHRWLLVLATDWFLITAFHEKVLGAAASVLLYALLLTFLGNFNVFGWVWDNPTTILYWGGGYVQKWNGKEDEIVGMYPGSSSQPIRI